jgi:hypothetical protein
MKGISLLTKYQQLTEQGGFVMGPWVEVFDYHKSK